MKFEYLREWQGTYLEDSYLLGITCEERNLRLKMLFALTLDHEAYTPPAPGEHHCYREGSIFIERPSILEWCGKKAVIVADPDGTFDMGSIELYRESPTVFRVITEWFDAKLTAANLTVDVH